MIWRLSATEFNVSDFFYLLGLFAKENTNMTSLSRQTSKFLKFCNSENQTMIPYRFYILSLVVPETKTSEWGGGGKNAPKVQRVYESQVRQG